MRDSLRRNIDGLNRAGLGIVVALVDALTDIEKYQRKTPRRKTPITLIASAPRPRASFVERAREPHFLVDHQMNTIAASTALQNLLEVSATDLLGTDWESIMDGPDELRLVREKWLIAAQTHQGFSHTFRCRTGRGRIVFLFMRVVPVEHPTTGTFNGFFGTVRAQAMPLTLMHSEEQSA